MDCSQYAKTGQLIGIDAGAVFLSEKIRVYPELAALRQHQRTLQILTQAF